ncbi:peptidoglycan-binding protein [Candidatus Kaiserbacteria bacterium]|nr:peptidoglycan-binding protein [Candidatus Kaiserbacteria bacterium]
MNSIFGFVVGLLLLASPLLASADTASQITALQAQIQALLAQIAAMKTAPANTTRAGVCPALTRNLIIGSTDSLHDDEVLQLQLFLTDQGVYRGPATGYYGNLTAAAVMKWQLAHGMDFVTLKSGVGKMTRAKIRESCTSPESFASYSDPTTGLSFKYPPTYKIYTAKDQSVALTRLYSDGHGDTISTAVSPTLGAATFADYLAKNPMHDANSGREIPFNSLKARVFGSQTYYYRFVELFEGVLVVEYYILHGDKIYTFNLNAQGIAWSDPKFDAENDPGHRALKQLLATVTFTNQ